MERKTDETEKLAEYAYEHRYLICEALERLGSDEGKRVSAMLDKLFHRYEWRGEGE